MRVSLLIPLLAGCLSVPALAQTQVDPSPTETGAAAQGAQGAASGNDADAAESAATKVPLDEIKRFVGVFRAVEEAYVDPVDEKKLMSAAVRGLLLDLDPHSAYLQKEDAQAFDEDTNGAYDGIGVEVQQQPDGSVRVIAPIDDTPAARAGIKSGDLIVAVDGKPLSIESSQGGGPLRGLPGSTTRLTIVRDGADKPLDISVKRETIKVTSVRSRLLEPGYGYVRVSAFQADTAAEFEKQVKALQAKSGGALRGLVMDLRSNPGGLLTAAVQIADDLLDRGKIVSTRGRISISDAQFGATPGDLMKGAPVMVIVDAGSASASEVLAGALHDNKRARIIGSRTFGKGSVQTLLPLDNGDSVKLTTARYYTPSGKSIQARGIDPDVVLKPENAEDARPDYAESLLPGHLLGDDEALAGSNAGEVLDGDKPITAALAELKSPGATARAAAQAKAPPPKAAAANPAAAAPKVPARAPANAPANAPAEAMRPKGQPLSVLPAPANTAPQLPAPMDLPQRNPATPQPKVDDATPDDMSPTPPPPVS